MVAQEMLNEITMLKTRLFELDEILKERTLLYNRLIHVSGKAEGIAEVEKMIDLKIDEGIRKVLEVRKVAKKRTTKKPKIDMQKPEVTE